MKRMKLGQCLLWLPIHCCIIAFLVMLTVKTSNPSHSLLWVKVFSPIWLAMALFVWFMWIFNNIDYIIWGTVSVLSLALWTILLPIKFDWPNVNMSWWGIMIPFWVFLALANILRNEKRDEKVHDYRTGKKVYQIHFGNAIAVLFVHSILESLNMTGIASISWTIRFIPFFYYIFVVITAQLSMSQMNNYHFVQIIPGLIACFLILLYVNGKGLLKYTSVVLIPIYLLELIVFIGGFFMVKW